MVLYLARFHPEPGGAFGVAVVDLPGCFTQGHSLQDAAENAEEAILGHIDTMLAHGMTVPEPSTQPPADLEANEILAAIPVDLNKLDAMNKTIRLNVTIPLRTVALLDAVAKRENVSRSRLLTRAADAFVGTKSARISN